MRLVSPESVVLVLFLPTSASFGCPPPRIRLHRRLSTNLLVQQAHKKGGSSDDNDDVFVQSLVDLDFSPQQQSEILRQLEDCGLYDPHHQDSRSNMLLTLTKGLAPESVASMLKDDFGLSSMRAHQIRAALSNIERSSKRTTDEKKSSDHAQPGRVVDPDAFHHENPFDVIVSKTAQERYQEQNDDHNYGLPRNHRRLQSNYPILSQELDQFLAFMTKPSIQNQEPPIRSATAEVYLKHARLFLGWYIRQQRRGGKGSRLSVKKVFPSSDRTSATCIIDYLEWMRTTRKISVTYEASLIRGLLKLVKFRFAEESRAESRDDDKPFHDSKFAQTMPSCLILFVLMFIDNSPSDSGD